MHTATAIAAALAIATTPAIASAKTSSPIINTGYSAPHAIHHPGCQREFSKISVAGRIMGVTAMITYWCPTKPIGLAPLRLHTAAATSTVWPVSHASRAL